jgi:hypothetical protein
VSPSWRDQLRIGLCPDRLLLAAYGRGFRPRLVKTETVAFEPSSQTPWAAPLAALPAAIARAGLRRPKVTVVLSNHFVRYAVLPWSAALRNDAAWQALARHHFAGVHGPASEGWAVRLSARSLRGARVAAAIDAALLDGLARAIGESGASFESAQPYLMAAFNRACRAVGKESCWLAVEEPGRLTLALLLDGSWRSVRSRRADGAWPDILPETLEREGAVLGLDQPCSRVLVCSERAADADLEGLQLRDLTLPIGEAPGHRALAMVMA